MPSPVLFNIIKTGAKGLNLTNEAHKLGAVVGNIPLIGGSTGKVITTEAEHVFAVMKKGEVLSSFKGKHPNLAAASEEDFACAVESFSDMILKFLRKKGILPAISEEKVTDCVFDTMLQSSIKKPNNLLGGIEEGLFV